MNHNSRQLTVSEIVFHPFKESRTNGSPCSAYSGIKPRKFSDTELYVKLPKNPIVHLTQYLLDMCMSMISVWGIN